MTAHTEPPTFLEICAPVAEAIQTASARLNIDLARSWLVGARPPEIEAGRRAGCKTILLRSSAAARDSVCSADFVSTDLPNALRLLLQTA